MNERKKGGNKVEDSPAHINDCVREKRLCSFRLVIKCEAEAIISPTANKEQIKARQRKKEKNETTSLSQVPAAEMSSAFSFHSFTTRPPQLHRNALKEKNGKHHNSAGYGDLTRGPEREETKWVYPWSPNLATFPMSCIHPIVQLKQKWKKKEGT